MSFSWFAIFTMAMMCFCFRISSHWCLTADSRFFIVSSASLNLLVSPCVISESSYNLSVDSHSEWLIRNWCRTKNNVPITNMIIRMPMSILAIITDGISLIHDTAIKANPDIQKNVPHNAAKSGFLFSILSLLFHAALLMNLGCLSCLPDSPRYNRKAFSNASCKDSCRLTAVILNLFHNGPFTLFDIKTFSI